MRKRKRASSDPGIPPWMVTFSDLVTLLMTFFIVLVSMASLVDTHKRKVALGSVAGAFGKGARNLDDLTTVDTKKSVTPGPVNMFDDLAPLEKQLWERPDQDLRFESNRFVQRLSIHADALFTANSSELTDRGRALLDRLLPVMAGSAYPLALSGHTAGGFGELGPDYEQPRDARVDFSWELSLRRVLAVYRYFVGAGIDPEKLRVEAFGRFHPVAENETPEGRKRNRRVDITLDRRISGWSPELAARDAQEEKEKEEGFRVRDFLFRFDLPGERRP